MDIAAAGALILFFSILIALILVGLVVFGYAAYSFLVVLSNTAVGNDEVIWPGEPIQDWFFKVWYLGWLVAVWAVPASFVVSLVGLPRPFIAVGVAACLWLLFPVGLLSSLSAESQLVVLRPFIVLQLLKHLGASLRFYVSSGLLVGVCGTLVYAAVFGLNYRGLDQPLILIPLAAVACATGGLIYARLLGRTAFMTGQSSSDKSSVLEADTPAAEKPRQKKKLRARKPSRAFDPWAVPGEEPARKTKPTPSRAPLPEDPYGPAEGTYEVLAEEAFAPPGKPRPGQGALEQEEVEPYAVSVPTEPPSKLPSPVTPGSLKFEEELAAPRVLPPLPDMPLVTGVYSFPFYPQSMGPWGTLAAGLFGVIALSRLLVYLYPF